MPKKRPKLLILDGNALVHRSFHALPPTLATKSGQTVNAVYGFTSFLLKAIKEFKPKYLALTLDRAEPTFRHEQFKAYKATRVKAPDELYEQIPIVKQVAKAFNIPVYEKAGFEADDLIGTVCQKVDGKIDKIIVTGDLDTLQLVNEHTFVYTMSHGVSDSALYNETEVRKRFGFGPEQLVDYKALRGDPSDNIPGVKGIGEKTATDLIKQFKTLDNLYRQLDSEKISERIRRLLTEEKSRAYLSRELAEINCQVEIDFSLNDVKFGDYHKDQILELFAQLEFKSLLGRLKEIDEKFVPIEHKLDLGDKFSRDRQQFNYQLITDDRQFDKFLAKLKQQKEFTLDTETTDLDNFKAELLGLSFSWQEGEAYYLVLSSGQAAKGPVNLFNYNQTQVKPVKSLHPWLEKLKPILANEQIKKFGHNLKFDIKVLSGFGLKVNGLEFDTMIASYLLNPGQRQHNLDSLVFSELGWEKISKDDLLGQDRPASVKTGRGRQKINFSQVAPDKLGVYSCEDADFTQRLVNKLSLQLKQEKLGQLFSQMEMPLVKVLAKLESHGIGIDPKYFKDLDRQTDRQIAALQKKIWQLAGRQFNINSVQQLREILFNKLKLSVVGLSKTKTGISTGVEELVKLRGLHPIIDLLFDYRELSKLSTTYIKTLPLLVNQVTGRVHTNYQQAVTATGRLSSTNPNLQNIPIRTEAGQQIRQGFVAGRGKVLLSLDYSQIELRLAAHLSGDPKLIKAFKNNQDIHRATAAAINNVPLDQVTSAMRREAKAVNFGILYGQGPHGLALGTSLTYEQAKAFIDNYFKIYKKVKTYIDRTIAKAQQDGYVETLFHRRRYLNDINSSMAMARKSAERMAINTPLQGSAADMIKIAMIQIDNLLEKKFGDKVKMILQVHDELVFELDKDLVKTVAPALQSIMANVTKLDVPVVVDCQAGKSWGEMKKI